MNLLAAFQYRPFLSPLPIWDYWAWCIIPLAIGVSVVYKSIRCPRMAQVPRQAAEISFYILLCMALAAGILTLIVGYVQRN